MSFKFASAFAALAFAVAAIAPASAERAHGQNVITTSVAVPYGDLDLSQARDVRRLKLRLNRALKRVCGESAVTASPIIRRSIEACRTEAKSMAMASIQAPMVLAALQTGKWG